MKHIQDFVEQCMRVPASAAALVGRLQDRVTELTYDQRAAEALEQLVSNEDDNDRDRRFTSINRADLGQLMLIVNKQIREDIERVQELVLLMRKEIDEQI